MVASMSRDAMLSQLLEWLSSDDEEAKLRKKLKKEKKRAKKEKRKAEELQKAMTLERERERERIRERKEQSVKMQVVSSDIAKLKQTSPAPCRVCGSPSVSPAPVRMISSPDNRSSSITRDTVIEALHNIISNTDIDLKKSSNIRNPLSDTNRVLVYSPVLGAHDEPYRRSLSRALSPPPELPREEPKTVWGKLYKEGVSSSRQKVIDSKRKELEQLSEELTTEHTFRPETGMRIEADANIKERPGRIFQSLHNDSRARNRRLNNLKAVRDEETKPSFVPKVNPVKKGLKNDKWETGFYQRLFDEAKDRQTKQKELEEKAKQKATRRSTSKSTAESQRTFLERNEKLVLSGTVEVHWMKRIFETARKALGGATAEGCEVSQLSASLSEDLKVKKVMTIPESIWVKMIPRTDFAAMIDCIDDLEEGTRITWSAFLELYHSETVQAFADPECTYKPQFDKIHSRRIRDSPRTHSMTPQKRIDDGTTPRKSASTRTSSASRLRKGIVGGTTPSRSASVQSRSSSIPKKSISAPSPQRPKSTPARKPEVTRMTQKGKSKKQQRGGIHDIADGDDDTDEERERSKTPVPEVPPEPVAQPAPVPQPQHDDDDDDDDFESVEDSPIPAKPPAAPTSPPSTKRLVGTSPVPVPSVAPHPTGVTPTESKTTLAIKKALAAHGANSGQVRPAAAEGVKSSAKGVAGPLRRPRGGRGAGKDPTPPPSRTASPVVSLAVSGSTIPQINGPAPVVAVPVPAAAPVPAPGVGTPRSMSGQKSAPQKRPGTPGKQPLVSPHQHHHHHHHHQHHHHHHHHQQQHHHHHHHHQQQHHHQHHQPEAGRHTKIPSVAPPSPSKSKAPPSSPQKFTPTNPSNGTRQGEPSPHPSEPPIHGHKIPVGPVVKRPSGTPTKVYTGNQPHHHHHHHHHAGLKSPSHHHHHHHQQHQHHHHHHHHNQQHHHHHHHHNHHHHQSHSQPPPSQPHHQYHHNHSHSQPPPSPHGHHHHHHHHSHHHHHHHHHQHQHNHHHHHHHHQHHHHQHHQSQQSQGSVGSGSRYAGSVKSPPPAPSGSHPGTPDPNYGHPVKSVQKAPPRAVMQKKKIPICNLCKRDKTLVKICPVTQQDHKVTPGSDRSALCGSCGNDTRVVQICPQTGAPHKTYPPQGLR